MVKVENLFLLLSVVFGLGILFVNPLFRTPDEVRHFWRSYQVSQGTILPSKSGTVLGGTLPASIVHIEDWQGPKSIIKILADGSTPAHSVLNYKLSSESRESASFPNTALYSPIPYLGSAAGITIGRISDSPIIMGHLGRIFNLMLWIAICYLSIRLIPFGKFTLLVLCLNPVALQQAASFSADVLTLALSVLGVALVARCFTLPHLSTRYLLGMLVVFSLLGLCKQPFVALSLLVLIVPIKQFGTKRRYGIWSTGIIVASLAAALLWIATTNKFFIPTRTDVLIQPSEQLRFVALHPLHFVESLVQTYVHQGLHISEGLSGLLGYGDLAIPAWATALLYVALPISLFTNTIASPLSKYKKTFLLALGALIFCAINLLIYMSWARVGAPLIEGLQGRYFLPLITLLPFFASKGRGWQRLAGFALVATVCLNLVLGLRVLAH